MQVPLGTVVHRLVRAAPKETPDAFPAQGAHAESPPPPEPLPLLPSERDSNVDPAADAEAASAGDNKIMSGGGSAASSTSGKLLYLFKFQLSVIK